MDLYYSNEFLKKLEPVISKNDMPLLKKIKSTLEQISNTNVDKVLLKNIKTHGGEDIFASFLEEGKHKYAIFWTVKLEKTVILSLTKKTEG